MNSLFQAVLDTPWRAINELRRPVMQPYYRLLLAFYGIPWGHNWRFYGMPIVQRYRGSEMTFGADMELRSWRASNPLAPNHPVVLATRTSTAILRIGDNVGMTGATLVASDRVEIGNRVLVGANVTITDSDFHPLTPAERARDMLAGGHAPVIIEDDVFIGMNSLILKGVRIGAASVIGAGSVITRDIPPGVIAAGNPAHVIRDLDP